MRFLAWIGGFVFGVGIAIQTAPALTWMNGGARNQRPFLIAAIVVFIGLRLIRSMTKSPAVRSASSWASWTAAILLLIASLSVSMDKKAAGYRVQMVAELQMIRDAEEQARRDSGRYSPAPDYGGVIAGLKPEISITRDGWKAVVEHDQLPGVRCAMYTGSESSAPAIRPGEAQCTKPKPSRAELWSGLPLMVAGALLVAFSHA